MPPMAPTVPSVLIVPVTATEPPPVSSPGVSRSMIASVNASPALGPPTSSVRRFTAKGRFGMLRSVVPTPRNPALALSGLAASVAFTVWGSPCCCLIVNVTSSPGLCAPIASRNAADPATALPSTAVTESPGSSPAISAGGRRGGGGWARFQGVGVGYRRGGGGGGARRRRPGGGGVTAGQGGPGGGPGGLGARARGSRPGGEGREGGQGGPRASRSPPL